MKYASKAVYDIEAGHVVERIEHEYDGPWALCDRAAQQQAQAAEGTAASTAAGLGTTAAGVGGTVIPGYTKEATNPPGFGPAGLATMETAAQETAAGSGAGARGALMERAMRLRNPAGVSADIAAGTQGAARSAGGAVEGVLSADEQLKQKQQEQGLQGLSGIYGADTGAMLKAMGLEGEDINAEVNAGKSGWLQNLEGGLGLLQGAGYGKLKL